MCTPAVTGASSRDRAARAVGRAHGGIGVAGQELSLTAGEQHLGDPGGGQHADVPVRRVGMRGGAGRPPGIPWFRHGAA